VRRPQSAEQRLGRSFAHVPAGNDISCRAKA
jgi:hypothetical protein